MGREDCSLCHHADDTYQCVWCTATRTCVYQKLCRSSAPVQCPNPEITDVSQPTGHTHFPHHHFTLLLLLLLLVMLEISGRFYFLSFADPPSLRPSQRSDLGDHQRLQHGDKEGGHQEDHSGGSGLCPPGGQILRLHQVIQSTFSRRGSINVRLP